MLNSVIGRSVEAPLGRPVETRPSSLAYQLNDLIKIAYERSPEIKAKDKMIAATEAKVSLAKKDYIPDFTITGGYFARGNDFRTCGASGPPSTYLSLPHKTAPCCK